MRLVRTFLLFTILVLVAGWVAGQYVGEHLHFEPVAGH